MFIELFGKTFQENTGKTDELFIFVTINLLCGRNRIITNKFDVKIVFKKFPFGNVANLTHLDSIAIGRCICCCYHKTSALLNVTNTISKSMKYIA